MSTVDAGHPHAMHSLLEVHLTMFSNLPSVLGEPEEPYTAGRDLTLFSLSQNTSSSNADSTSAGRPGWSTSPIHSSGASRKPRQTLESPCRPVTISFLQHALRHKVDSHQDLFNLSSPVSVVGWPMDVNNTTFMGQGESAFKVNDGSGLVTVCVPVSSENEEWMIEKLKSVMGVTDSVLSHDVAPRTSQLFYLRLVGTVSLESHNQIILRCIHFRRAKTEEIAFYHTLDVLAHTLMPYEEANTPKQESLPSVNIPSNSAASNPRVAHLDKVHVPEAFSLCETNPCQSCILRYIMKYREKLKGVESRQLLDDLSSIFPQQEISQNIQALNDMAFCMETETGYIDLVIDEEDHF